MIGLGPVVLLAFYFLSFGKRTQLKIYSMTTNVVTCPHYSRKFIITEFGNPNIQT